MDIFRILLVVIVVLLLFGGVGGHFGLWGGPAYSSYYGPGIGIGTILLVILLVWFLR